MSSVEFLAPNWRLWKTICLDVFNVGRSGLYGMVQPSWRCSTFNPKSKNKKSKTKQKNSLFLSQVSTKTWKWIEVSPIVHIFIRRPTKLTKKKKKKKKKLKKAKKKRMKIEPERCIYNQIGKRATQRKKTRQTAAAAEAADHRVCWNSWRLSTTTIRLAL